MPSAYEFYQARLQVDKHRIDDHLEEQAQYLDEIGGHKARAATALSVLKDELAAVEAELMIDAKNGGASDTAAKAMVSSARQRREAASHYITAREEFECWDSLYEAWKARGYALSKLADLHNGQYFAHAQTSAGRRPVHRETPDSEVTAIREAQQRTREERSLKRRRFDG